jgi:L-idonate 5-dehydrogenase
MRALVIHAPHDLRIESVSTPPLDAHQVLVRVCAGGICGSDLHYYHHGGFGTVRLKEPMILGHEIAGTVEAAGPAVTRVAPGTRIAINPSQPCRRCRFCLDGTPNHCADMRFYGSAMRFPHVQGAFREQLVIDEAQAAPISDATPMGIAAMAEPLSVGLHAIQQAGNIMGKRVLVTGCGPIGSLLIGALRRAGAAEIVAVDLATAPLECALKMGADRAIHASEEADALSRYAQDKGYFDVMFEASGAEKALRSALECLRPRGVVVAVGLGGECNLPMTMFVAKELELRGSFRFHKEFEQAALFLDKGLIDVRPVLSESIPFENAIEAFQLAGDRAKAIKVQLSFI